MSGEPRPRAIEFAIAAAFVSNAVLLLLAMGWARPWVLAPIAVACAVAIAGRCRFSRAYLLYAPFGALYLIHALAPATAPDAIGYHLGIASEWYRTGSLASEAAGFYDVIPLGLETLFTLAMPLGGLRAGAVVHLLFLFATVPLLIALGARLDFDARPAALIYFCSPVVGVTAAAAYVDAASVFFAVAALHLLLTRDFAWAGLLAGFCYAVKLSGLPVTLAVVAYLAWRREWRGVLLAAAMAAPWMLRAWWLTGNPVAPMLALAIPSPAYYSSAIQSWNEFVRSYGVPWSERAGEAVLGGARAQGLLGPAYLLAPVALLALRRRSHAVLLLAAAIASAGWWVNTGTRFLMPAAAFVAMALCAVLPRNAAWALALAQAALCWPAALDRWAHPNAWRLPAAIPWRAAVRSETKAEYLGRVKPDALIGAMVDRHAEQGQRVLDLGEAPRAYFRTARAMAFWQYPAAARAAEALWLADSPLARPLRTVRAAWPRRRLKSLRFELTASSPDAWSVQEVELHRDGRAVLPSSDWELHAAVNPWDMPFAFDRNRASAWGTWGRRGAGMALAVSGDFELDGAVLLLRGDEAPAPVRVTGVDERGGEVALAPRMEHAESDATRNLRREATRYARREGFAWILAYRNAADRQSLHRSLEDSAADWGLRRVDEAAGATLLGIEEPER